MNPPIEQIKRWDSCASVSSDIPLLPPRGIGVYFHLLLNTFPFLYRHLLARYRIAFGALNHYINARLFFHNLISSVTVTITLVCSFLPLCTPYIITLAIIIAMPYIMGTRTHSPAEGHLRGFWVFPLLSVVPWTLLLEFSNPDQDLPRAVVLAEMPSLFALV